MKLSHLLTNFQLNRRNQQNKMSKKISKYGWTKDALDARDFVFQPKAIKLPPSVDLRPQFPVPCYDQGQLGSCTANAIAGALEFDQVKQKQKQTPFTPSRLFIYYNERSMEGTIKSDAGAQIRDGIKSVAKLGAPPEKIWPYTPSKFATKPDTTASITALLYTATSYAAVKQTSAILKQALVAGFPVVFGFSVYESFESDEVAKTGVVPMPKKGESIIGGHAVLCMGYDTLGRFIVRNSWGTDWGIDGHFLMPAAYITNPALASDFWTINSVKQ